ncbi:hypothetical protein PVW48_03660 [Dinoroseobacter sp. PD6]|uniref:hypothetical protein n=1 Tax=Dinoroseobacter sp. PD6 TaxID=3028384 RepID=UPI00237A433E|nr:hypothetical protein [Dinoroseobacter sp. PD6]MDD9715823.1 hypothetical protein [Dinoroseobacter sp. PD6]
MTDIGQTNELVGLEIPDFQPVAYFDKHMDCIRVLTHDRSVCEVRIDDTFTLHRCNHRSDTDPKYVGFTIKGVRHLFSEIGLPQEGVYRLADIVDRIVKTMPGSAVAAITDLIFDQYKAVGDFRIHFDGEEHLAA